MEVEDLDKDTVKLIPKKLKMLQSMDLSLYRIEELVLDLDKSTVLVAGTDVPHRHHLTTLNTERLGVITFLSICPHFVLVVLSYIVFSVLVQGPPPPPIIPFTKTSLILPPLHV